jgi:low affinity Fe/Cu permease
MDDRIPHREESRGGFDEVAERAGGVVSGAPFFFTCVVLVIVWLPTLAFFGAEASQFVLQTVIAVVTLLLVALLQNSQKRSEDAVSLKLDAIAQGVADLMRAHTGEDKDLRDNIDRLAETVGLEERMSTQGNRSRQEAS